MRICTDFFRHISITLGVFLLLVSTTVFSDVWVYSVKEGDNLWDLTVDYLVDVSYVKKVQLLNNISDPWQILPGTEIKIPAKWLRSFPMLVRVRSIQGEAEIIDEDNTSISKLTAGTLAIVGDIIKTSDNSTVLLEFIDGTRLGLEENSELKIEFLGGYEYTGMSESRLYLKKGRLETQVVPKKGSATEFKIITPVSVTSVRGTNYRISSESENTVSHTEVIEGSVNVNSLRKTRLIPGGFGTIAFAKKPPKPPIPLLEPPPIDAIPRVFDRVPIQFTLPELAKAQGYRVQIAKTPEFGDMLFNKPYSSGFIRTIDLPDGHYLMRIRGINSEGLEGKNALHNFELNARPEAPFLVEPKPGAGLLEEKPIFVWSKNKISLGYHFQLSKTIDFSEVLINVNNTKEGEFTPDEPLNIGKYYWRVAAIDQDGDGPFSDPQLLRRIMPAPEMDAPEISEDSLVIRFRSGLPGQKYQVQMAADEVFTELLRDEQLSAPELEIPIPGPGEYFVRIRTIDPDGFIGPYGSAQAIDIPRDGWYWFLVLLPLFALFAL